MNYIVKHNQMYQAECSAVNRGLGFSLLMEKAGTACAELIAVNYPDAHTALIICGKGKNGGDGYVIARVLKAKGYKIRILAPCGMPFDEISVNNMKLVDKAGIYETDDYQPLIDDSDIIVDAVFGTGFRGALDEKLSALADAVNKSGKDVIAVDIPSGAECDSGEIHGTCFEADMTIAVSALKPIHVIKPARNVCGKIEIADIGIIPSDFNGINPVEYTSGEREIGEMLPARPENSNKGTFGNALIIAGSRNMPGAAKIASAGAVRCGAGLVTLAFPDAAYNAIAPSVTEQVMLPCKSNEVGTFSQDALDEILEKAKKCTCALIGCGIGLNTDTLRLVNRLIREIEIPLVIDADGLNAAAKNPYILSEAKAPVILTPHPGEMSRLTGKSVEEITANPSKTAKEFADKYNCTVILKGANTIIASCGSKEIYVNTTGNSGLAKGGSGDLLAGILVSLLAQGMKPVDAAVTAVYIHGDCADEVAMFSSERGMTVSDMISYLPSYFEKYER